MEQTVQSRTTNENVCEVLCDQRKAVHGDIIICAILAILVVIMGLSLLLSLKMCTRF